MRGLSPRGRGNQCPALVDSAEPRAGSIPAWAGEPRTVSVRTLVAYHTGSIPAWAGEPWRSSAYHATVVRAGSIPAWAGEPGGTPHGRNVRDGSIPAWAGEPLEASRYHQPGDGVYPRVGGGTADHDSLDQAGIVQGLSPRGRGNLPAHPGGPSVLHGAKGLSPRGRGNRAQPCRR